MNRADTFFTQSEKDAISAAIKDVENKTAGEVAVMVVDESDSYPEAVILAGIIFGGFAGLIIADFFLGASLWHFIPLAFGFSLLASLLIRRAPSLLRYFISPARLEERVEKRALRAFYEQGLYKTRDNTGVLFFLSLFERKVWVLADEGIYQKIDKTELAAYATEVAAAVKSGNAAAVLCTEITRVGAILAEHFPIKDDDTNELSNRVIVGG